MLKGDAGFRNLEWTPGQGQQRIAAAACWRPAPATDWKGKDKGKCKGKGKSLKGKDPRSGPTRPQDAPLGGSTQANSAADSDKGFCKFFGCARGCDNQNCSFSHANPNSVAPCQFKQKAGSCDKGDACTYRHQPWESADHALQHYAARETGHVENAVTRYKQLHRGGGKEDEVARKLQAEHVEGVVERELQIETYGAAAVRMMEKMGYKAGAGLGKNLQGGTRLAKPCQALEQASQNCALGFGHFGAAASASVAERAARLAAARAQKRQRLEDESFFQHHLEEVSSGDDSEDMKDEPKPVVKIEREEIETLPAFTQ